MSRLGASIALVSLCTYQLSCSEVGHASVVNALAAQEGVTEAELIGEAGPPTRKQGPSSDCTSKGGTHMLVYESRTQWLGGRLGSELSSQVTACIDASGRVVTKQYFQY